MEGDDVPVQVKVVDMSPGMREDAVAVAKAALQEHKEERLCAEKVLILFDNFIFKILLLTIYILCCVGR